MYRQDVLRVVKVLIRRFYDKERSRGDLGVVLGAQLVERIFISIVIGKRLRDTRLTLDLGCRAIED